jgi:CMP/dCMP kinase
LIVTIDGPAGAGKSTVAKRLAREIGFDFLDTGAMYRCVTLACLRANISLEDPERVASIARRVQIDLAGTRVFLNSEDVTESIRTPTVTNSIRTVADNQSVRELMVTAQREWISGKNAVTEGRDQGTIAFPHADCKIFLTASPEERARRRVAQLIEIGVDASYDEILLQQNLRDAQDTKRKLGGLKPAEDAITICTDGMTEEDVLKSLVAVVQQRQPVPNKKTMANDSACSRSETQNP